PPTPAGLEPWTPSSYTAFKVILSARLCAAIWNNIQDCDETFNYWEPTHFLLYGRGLQTWEYAPQYALRSYAYLLLHALPGYLYSALLQSNRLLVFYFLRCVLGLGCSLAEVYFYRGVCREFGANVGRLTLGFLVLSAGMFIAGAAYLPSSFSMYMCMLSMGAWFSRAYPLAIFGTALSALVGWPFAALLGLPIALDVLLRQRQPALFIKWSLVSLAVLVAPMTKIDSDMYGRLVSAPFNIVAYNVFSSTGANLYGTEPLSFYFVNGFLNFNIGFVLALVALPACAVVSLVIRLPRKSALYLPSWLALAPLYLWLLVFCAQAHKEERFLFPAYPLVCLAAAVCLDSLQKLWYHLVVRAKAAHYLQRTGWLAVAALALYGAACLSRVVGQYRGYHAPLDAFMELNRLAAEEMHEPRRPLLVCVGKEWHRFPSSFFLPELNWRLGFLESDFRGQLPQYFTAGANATRLRRDGFNDRNAEEPGRYVDAAHCHLLVDADTAESPRQPSYSRRARNWTVLHSTPFLDAARSSRVLRAFYVPFLTERHCQYVNYNLLVNNEWRDQLFKRRTVGE
ncbi:alpha-1,2-mannosyltransferase ALG9-like, partial [Pollicipes pollicipes]|uniref:alpha-1,2-mannosyltransferase ALG9-like n=1 Tax=Pollicipes pollicipes TaxID=41117 RepID=UPI001884BD02